jgi:hypothetical protein
MENATAEEGGIHAGHGFWANLRGARIIQTTGGRWRGGCQTAAMEREKGHASGG